MKRIFTFCVIALSISINVYGVVRVSAGPGPADWAVAGSWVPAGIPNSGDDITISAGHIINISTTSNCRNLTVDGTLRGLGYARNLNVYGTYTLNGAEDGNAAIISFYGVGSPSIGGAGTFNPNFRWTFYRSRTILGNVSSVRAATVKIYGGYTVTNNGDITLNLVNLFNTSGGSGWINAAGSTLTLRNANFFAGTTLNYGLFDASAAGNTVIIQYASGDIPNTVAGYYDLDIASTTTGTKILRAATVVSNDLTINALNTLSSNGFDLTIAGDWANAGTFTAGTRTVTFNGTSTVSGVSTTSFNNVTISGTLTGHATTMNVGGNWVDNGTYNHNSGTVVFNGTSTVSGASTTSFNNVTISGTLTAHATAMNIAGNFVNNGTFNHNNGAVGFNGTTTVSGTSTTTFNDINITGTLTGHATNMNLIGDWVNDGTFNDNNGTVTFNGTLGPQTLSGTGATTFEGLTINNAGGVSISNGAYSLEGVLTMTSGTFNTFGNSFTMESTAGQTARIAQVPPACSILGNFIVERWITGRYSTYADLSSPVSGSTFADWDNELFLSYNYNPPSEYPSAWTYDEAADDFSPVTLATTALTPGRGFELYITEDGSYTDWTAKAINSVGVPNQGDQDLSALVSFDGAGSNLVGNPFASSIDWDAVLTASNAVTPGGLLANFDIYDYTIGNYRTFGSGDEIGSSQGFWVYTTMAGANFEIPESAKTTSSNSSLRSSSASDHYFTLKLSSTDQNNTFAHILKVAAAADATNGWDVNKDHPYRRSPERRAPCFYTVIEGKKSVIDVFNSENEDYTMPLTTTAGISGNYVIEAAGFEFLSEYPYIQLEDKLLNKYTDLSAQPYYAFTLNADESTDRFVVHFSKKPNGTVSVESSVYNGNQVVIFPSSQGNLVKFNFSEPVNTTITVTNILGQPITEVIALDASNQSVDITLSEDFHGIYIVRVESENGVLNKKFIKK